MPTATLPDRTSLVPLERAVLVTLAYSDLFDYPLKAQELQRYLPVPCGDDELDGALSNLDRFVSRHDELLCLRGREELVELRRRRAELSEERWHRARRFAAWLAHVPFLRMVAVCGSQAVDNGDAEGDVDLFLITAPRRLWLVQSITMVLRRIGRLRFGIEICPNYLMTSNRLEVDRQNLYVAREIAQAVPLWGEDDYERFLAANRWIERFLPQLDLADRRHALGPRRASAATRRLEAALGGRLGHLLDRVIYRLLIGYYRIRLRHRGWRREEIESAYRRDRQSLITGGYAGAVAERFLEHAGDTLGEAGKGVSPDDLRRFFYGDETVGEASTVERLEADPHFADIFAQRYGNAS